MTCRIPTGLIATLLLAGAAACADPTTAARSISEQSLTMDAADDAAAVTSADLSEMVTGEILAGLPGIVGARPGTPAGCAYSPASGRFDCPTISGANGLTLERSFAIFGGGVPQSAYDQLTTDSLNFQVAITGSVSREGRTAWLNTARTLTLSGLAGNETQRSWSGRGVRNDSARVTSDGVARRTRIRSIDRIASVVFALPRADNPFPLSGSITHDITLSSTADNGTDTRTREVTRHVVVTFNGTRLVPVLVGDTRCTLDLVTKRMSCR